jgi:uncharacterized protein (DUF58 family)
MDDQHNHGQHRETAGFQTESYLAPETLVQLSTLELRARMIVEGIRSGSHTSPHQGMSVEFKQHRQYVPGDDLKHLDWRVYARSDRPTIKQYEQETTLDVSLLVDCSASMRFGSLKMKKGWGGTRSNTNERVWTKYDHATAVSAAISWMSLQQSDRVGLNLFAEDLVTSTSTRSTNDQWRRIITTLSSEPVDNGTEIERSVEHALSMIKNRSLIIIISDFLQDPDEIRNSIARIRHHNHDLICIQLLDDQELNLDITAPTTFVDIEGDERVNIDPNTIRDVYQEKLNTHNTNIKEMLLDFGYDHLLMNTHESVGPALTLLAARRMNWLKSRHVR